MRGVLGEQADPTRFVPFNGTWDQVLPLMPDASVDSVFALDVIEHMEKDDGLKFLREAERVARCQVMIFTPLVVAFFSFLRARNKEPSTPAKIAWGLAITGVSAVLMVLASVVGAFYYLKVIWYMYFELAEDQAILQASTDTRLLLSLNSLAVLALGIVPGWLLALCIQVLG